MIQQEVMSKLQVVICVVIYHFFAGNVAQSSSSGQDNVPQKEKAVDESALVTSEKGRTKRKRGELIPDTDDEDDMVLDDADNESDEGDPYWEGESEEGGDLEDPNDANSVGCDISCTSSRKSKTQVRFKLPPRVSVGRNAKSTATKKMGDIAKDCDENIPMQEETDSQDGSLGAPTQDLDADEKARVEVRFPDRSISLNKVSFLPRRRKKAREI